MKKTFLMIIALFIIATPTFATVWTLSFETIDGPASLQSSGTVTLSNGDVITVSAINGSNESTIRVSFNQITDQITLQFSYINEDDEIIFQEPIVFDGYDPDKWFICVNED